MFARGELTGLERELVSRGVTRGVTRGVAAELVRDFPEDRIQAQIEQVDWLRETKPKRIADVGATPLKVAARLRGANKSLLLR